MLERRITFYCGEAGLPAYQLNQLKKLTTYFQSKVELFNVSQLTRAPVSQPLKMLALANKPHALCQLIINGSDAELANLVLTDFIAQYGLSLSQFSPSLPFKISLPLTSIYSGKSNQSYSCINKAETIAQLSQMLVAQQAITSEQQPALQQALLARETISATVMGPGIAFTSEQQPALQQALLARETISATVMGPGIALPHVMHEMITKPAMAIVCHHRAIDWGSSRGNISRAIAMVLPKPPLKAVIMAFAQFSKCLLNDDFCAALTSAQQPQELKALVIEALR
ncbi:PTS sugar transporter subunit IIA [Photobacterium phosphoreum]|uniref:PTS sugar transporter subunit IIA n=1 Tax=Photobacterium phosphoreum TaxID=659 RepID=UPI000D161CE2|nr:PTS sugar transporter subunit IIA [Photobacterium phosphoreum]PTB30976.1 PTS fructose transporter subunit IIA [Photobacterium phosphoreum]